MIAEEQVDAPQTSDKDAEIAELKKRLGEANGHGIEVIADPRDEEISRLREKLAEKDKPTKAIKNPRKRVGPFDDVIIAWKGVSYTIESNRMMGAIRRIEEHVTLAELSEFASTPATTKFGKLSSAFASLLRYAGAQDLTDDDVYAGMWSGDSLQNELFPALEALLSLMLPPTLLVKRMDDRGDLPPGKPEPAVEK